MISILYEMLCGKALKKNLATKQKKKQEEERQILLLTFDLQAPKKIVRE